MSDEVMAAPDADGIWLERPVVVRIGGREFAVSPPTMRQVRQFRLRLNALQSACQDAAQRLQRAEARTPELVEAVNVAGDAMMDAVLRTVPAIDAVYEELLDTPDVNVGDELEAAFHTIHDFYLNPLARRLAAEARAKLQARRNPAPSRTASSPISSCDGMESPGTSSSGNGPTPSSDT